jgi:hypothetical protein
LKPFHSILAIAWLFIFNCALTCLSLSLKTQMLFLLLGLAPLLVLLLGSKSLEQQKEKAGGEFQASLSLWVWVLLGLGALAARVFQLTTLSLWPLEDEAMSSHYALELAQFGHWQWTYDFSGLPPLYIWVLGGVYRLFHISLATLWLPPALFSCLGLFFLYRGARRLFGPTLILVFTLLGAFSFWPGSRWKEGSWSYGNA